MTGTTTNISVSWSRGGTPALMWPSSLRMTTRMLSSRCRLPARSQSRGPKEVVKPANPRQACIVAEYSLSITTGQLTLKRVGRYCAARESKIILYLPGFNGLLEVCVKVSPAFNIRPVDATLLEGFHRAEYLLRPEFVQFRITLLNLSQHRVHLSEQGMVLWKRPRKC
jgi:hypothetical protein